MWLGFGCFGSPPVASMPSFSLDPQAPFTERVQQFVDVLDAGGEADIASDLRRALTSYVDAEARGEGLEALNALVSEVLEADVRAMGRQQVGVRTAA